MDVAGNLLQEIKQTTATANTVDIFSNTFASTRIKF